MTVLNLENVQNMPIEAITPYDNNPRRIPQEAIDAVARSIEMFGWQQPIVVDSENVIVVGHTRRLAALKLGMTEVPVYVTDLPPDKVKEYRLVDNKTSEMSGWDHDSLILELREFEASLLESFFPDVDLEIAQIEAASGPSEAEIDTAAKNVAKVTPPPITSQHTTEVVCPACFNTFQVRTRSFPVADEALMEELVNGEAE